MVSLKKISINSQKINAVFIAICFALLTLASTTSSFAAATERNVKSDDGAAGDGVTDDTQAIQNAIDTVAVTGGVVFFPAGTYKVTGPLIIKSSNTALIGASPEAVTLSDNGYEQTLLIQPVTGPPISNISIKGMRFSNSASYDANQGAGKATIQVDNSLAIVTDVAFENIAVDDSPIEGIGLKGQRVSLSNSSISGTGRYGITVNGTDVRILGNKIHQMSFQGDPTEQDAVYLNATTNVIFSGNSIGELRGDSSAINVGAATTQAAITSNSIVLSDINQIGAEIHSGSVSFVGNSIDGGLGFIGTVGVDVQEGSGVLISDTQFVGTWVQSPIAVQTAAVDANIDHVVVNNDASSSWAIALNNSIRTVVQNSTILNGNFGIDLGQSDGARIINNQVNVLGDKYNLAGPPINHTILENNNSGLQIHSDLTIGTPSQNSSIIMYSQSGSSWKCNPDNVGTFSCANNDPIPTETPTISPNGGSYVGDTTVALATATPGATIYYTIDGTDPTTSSNVYVNAFILTVDTTVKAFATAPGFLDSAIASAAFTITELPPPSGNDEFTKLLLHLDSDFSDSSSSNKTPTANGGISIDTTDFKFGPGSAGFDGSNDHLTFPDSPDWAFGTEDFTIDFWYQHNTNVMQTIASQSPNSSNQWRLFFESAGGPRLFFQLYSGGSVPITFETGQLTLTTGDWYHFAVVRSGNEFKIFKDGIQTGSTHTNSTSIPDIAGTLNIGNIAYCGCWSVSGNIDELRISKGIARWTTDFSNDLPTAPYASPPPPPPSSGNDEFTKLLMHMDTDFSDFSGSAHIPTPQGGIVIDNANAQIGTGSGLFDRVDDYVTFPDSPDWTFGSGDFTIDFWYKYVTENGSPQAVVTQSPNSNNQWRLFFEHVDFKLFFQLYQGGSVPISVSTASLNLVAGTWYHFAVTRSGNEYRFFQDGVQSGSTQINSTSINDIAGTLNFGNIAYCGCWDMFGNIDELRISKGVARWTSNFTPPTGPYN